MRRTRLLTGLSATAILTAWAPAQAFLTVGQGGAYPDLPQAEAAAAHGDVIALLPQPGTYSAVATSKGITIMGFPRARIATTGLTPAVRVTGLPATRSFKLEGIDLVTSTNGYRIDLQNNLGTVHVERVTVTATTSTAVSFALGAQNCAQVTIANSTLQGGAAVLASNSHVAISASVLRGADATLAIPSHGPFAAIVAQGAHVDIADTSAIGGNGATGPLLVYDPAPALLCTDTSSTSHVRCSGNATSFLQAGQPAFLPSGAAAMRGLYSFFTVDPRLVLLPTPGWPAIETLNTIVTAQQPTVQASGVPPGGSMNVNLAASANDLSQLAVGVPAPITATPVGDLWMDAATMTLLPAVTLPGSGSRQVVLPIPASPNLWGQAFALQHLAGTGSTFRLSAPATVILN